MFDIVKESFIEAWKRSFRPKNLFLFIFLSLSIWVMLYHTIIEYFSFNFSTFSLKSILKTLSIPLLYIILTSTVIRNVKEEKLKENLIFSIKKLPVLIILSIMLSLPFLCLAFAFKNSLTSPFGLIKPDLNFYNLMYSLTGISFFLYWIFFLFFSNLISLIEIFIAFLIGLAFLFLFQEVLIGNKRVKGSIIGTIKLFKHNYNLVALIEVICMGVSLIAISLLYAFLSFLSISFEEMSLFILLYLLVLGWISLFQVIFVTECYLRISQNR